MNRTTRVYLPLSLEQLRELRTAALDGAQLQAFAATAELERLLPAGEDAEGREFAALQDAALAAATMGAHVVAAADVDLNAVEVLHDSDLPASQVGLAASVPLRRVASLHLLDPVGGRDVDSDFELSWYDVSELDVVIDEVASR